MKENPRLKQAIQEIEKLAKRLDIAVFAVVHSPGASEYTMQINPSFSCAKEDDGSIDFNARVQEDFDGDVVRYKKTVEDTYEMLTLLAEGGGRGVVSLYQAQTVVKEHIKSDSNFGFKGNNTQQN